jgi:adenosylcobinamide-phosphate synthase
LRALETRHNHDGARRLKGAAALLALVLAGAGLAYLLAQAGPLVETLGAAILLAHKSLVEHVAAVAKGLRHSLAAGRSAVALIVSRDTAGMDETSVARAAIESAAENLSDGVIAPAFWFLLAGLPGITVYKIVNTADSMIGYRTPRYADFGWAAARSDDLLNIFPARLTALLLALPAGRFDLAAIRADARLHRSPNAGWPEAALARALGIALAGPRAYDGREQCFPFVNAAGRRTLAAEDVDASLTILWKAWGAALGLCLLIALIVP